MGQEVSQADFTREQRLRFREKVRTDLVVFERMLEGSRFDFTRPLMGLEIELNLLDGQTLAPAMINREVLADLGEEDFQTEVARYNIEMNVPPRPMAGDQAVRLDRFLTQALRRAGDAARAHGARVAEVGILPTLTAELFDEPWISEGVRYQGLNDSLLRERGEGMELEIEGPTGERVSSYHDTIGPLSGCTSVQLHQQVTPQDFPVYWNAASVISSLQVAMGANSPYLFGRRLWAETRIPLFTQMVDTRSVELKYQGVRPRAYFGNNWITSIFDLFEENVRSFPALLPETSEEDSMAVLEAGGVPELKDLKLHNGTVWRWNRPIYDTSQGVPHLRVENRVLPAGPSVVDTVANACFYYGLLEAATTSGRPIWTKMAFRTAEQNFVDAAKHGIDSVHSWPGLGTLPVTELVADHLLSVADDGLAALGLRREVRSHYLSVIEGRCRTRTNGASWQIAVTEAYETAGRSREEALREMFAHYLDNSEENAPVHTWPVPQPAASSGTEEDRG
ncbi:glutamate--cysteine ligase [Ornithinimicrobium sp. CNJ-824]|uniref:glutamate--cysteine ligase n=1 Tax=Ornithinimicrobium sp. CNJ-824 TaxID=1904966 RepID=UPI00096276DA|nr:glutamate--cysteine ligase [Ornithinimicrobium sp. CNJ-824]OLT22567.1 glutamate--cysteine ligase [Ornithinimicrobium sp. CNJ-824]